MKWFRDYYFISNGHVLAEESLTSDQVDGIAQKLARRHQTVVIPCVVVGEGVEPDKCLVCGEVLPETGPCWSCLYPEEEAIPFQGEAYPAKIYSEFEEYF